jgi:hypothetical protein
MFLGGQLSASLLRGTCYWLRDVNWFDRLGKIADQAGLTRPALLTTNPTRENGLKSPESGSA